MKLKILFLTFLLLGLSSCSNDDDNNSCTEQAIVDTSLFNSTPSAVDIESIGGQIQNNCFIINVSGLWCDNPTREAKLIAVEATSQDSDGVPIRRCALFLEPADDCGESINKTFSFDIESFRVPGTNQIRISLSGAGSNTFTYLY